MPAGLTEDAIRTALSKVQDPEIHRSITELDMVKEVHVAADGAVNVAIFLTVAGCPMKDQLTSDITARRSARSTGSPRSRSSST